MDINDFFDLSRRHLKANTRKYQRSFLREGHLKHRLSIIIGQRGVGKTTIIAQHLLNKVSNDLMSKEILYIPTDHFLIGNASLYETAEQFYQQGGKLIAFDEIHKYKEWSIELKSIYDTYPELTVIASGSSALEIHKGSHDLTRRAAIYNIQGLSFREYLELHLDTHFPRYDVATIVASHEPICHDIVTAIESKGKKVLALFKEYLKYGYYPYSIDINDHNIYFMTLEQNFHAAIEVDLAAVYPLLTGNSIRKLKQLLIFIASAVPFTPNLKKLKSLLDIGDERTLKSYFKYLEDAGLINLVMKVSKRIRKLETPEKIYLNNTNQLYAISPKSQNLGTIRELFFLSMLSHLYNVGIPNNGDFLVEDEWLFEIGGKKKNIKQVLEEKNAYLACDDLDMGKGNKIPLWLFGFVY
ncbi:MAG: AAA family ATPase [Coxiellaceae bacterium]|nr:AAA family ATPase [Coxiellaceae bacterium]